jgi:hypothetical protein
MGLYYAFDYHRRFREREVAAAQLETQLATAHLQALRMQINPHLLFNALHSAAMLTMIDPDGAHRGRFSHDPVREGPSLSLGMTTSFLGPPS